MIEVGDFIIKGLRKSYGGFLLDIPELVFRQGYVTGIIGDNGAGKTTLIGCMTGSAVPDAGEIDSGGMLPAGVVFDECPFPPDLKARKLSAVFAHMFPDWDPRRFDDLLEEFRIDRSKHVKEYSRGMRMKVQVAAALSRPTGMLVLDEPTAGMDPASREEFLDVIRDYMVDEGHTVVMSSHITTDVEKIADYVVLIEDGKAVLEGEKDAIMSRFGILHASSDGGLRGQGIVRRRTEPHGCSYLIDGRDEFRRSHPDMVVDPASLEDLMIMMSRGEEA